MILLPKLPNRQPPWPTLGRRAIVEVLEATNGDRVRAARLLGIGKTTIYRKLKKLGLDSRTAPLPLFESIEESSQQGGSQGRRSRHAATMCIRSRHRNQS